jgi:hypothetical protein
MSLEHAPTRQAAASTVSEFCQENRVSRAKLYQMWAQKTTTEPFGKGPRYFMVGSHRRISTEAAADWRRAGEAEAAEHGHVTSKSQLRRDHRCRTSQQFEKKEGVRP